MAALNFPMTVTGFVTKRRSFTRPATATPRWGCEWIRYDSRQPEFHGRSIQLLRSAGLQSWGNGGGVEAAQQSHPEFAHEQNARTGQLRQSGRVSLRSRMDIDVTPKLRSFANVNYIRFADPIRFRPRLLTDKVDSELGWDFSLGVQYRPLLTTTSSSLLASALFCRGMVTRTFTSAAQIRCRISIPCRARPGG